MKANVILLSIVFVVSMTFILDFHANIPTERFFLIPLETVVILLISVQVYLVTGAVWSALVLLGLVAVATGTLLPLHHLSTLVYRHSLAGVNELGSVLYTLRQSATIILVYLGDPLFQSVLLSYPRVTQAVDLALRGFLLSFGFTPWGLALTLLHHVVISTIHDLPTIFEYLWKSFPRPFTYAKELYLQYEKFQGLPSRRVAVGFLLMRPLMYVATILVLRFGLPGNRSLTVEEGPLALMLVILVGVHLNHWYKNPANLEDHKEVVFIVTGFSFLDPSRDPPKPKTTWEKFKDLFTSKKKAA